MTALCCFSASISWAQKTTTETPILTECRTNARQAEIDYENKIDRDEFNKRMDYYLSGADKQVAQQFAIQLHIVRRDDGTGGKAVADIRNEIANFVNPYFAGVGIEFVECNPELYHNSSQYYILGDGMEDPDVAGDAMAASFNVANVINIYFVSDPDGACGWARFPWNLPVDYMVIANSCADNNSTLVHELGHYFGLYHTHETFGGTKPESVTRNNANSCWDCEDDGDKLCDTPADPNLSSTANNFPSCAYTGSGTDECGVSYTPAIDNIMSYADKQCRTDFTAQQLARMAVYRDGDRGYLQNSCPCERPVAKCKNIDVNLSPAGNASISPSSVDNFSTWECGFGSWSVSPSSFDCGDVGGNVVTLTVTDLLGWVSTCNATVTIHDVTNPIVTPASNMTVECDGSGNVAAFNNWLNNHGGATASDACGGSWSNNSSGLSNGCGATGSETVTFTFTDPSNNSASTSATFTIEDNTDPSLTCPEDIHLPECVETATWTPIASDVCGGVTVVSVPASGSFFEKGTTTVVTVTATDDCGNVTQCTFEVTRDPDLEVDIDPLATSPLNTCALGTGANIVLGYGGGPTCVTLNAVGAGGHAPYTYAWDAPAEVPAGYFTDENTASPTFCAEFQTEPCAIYTFMVTITDIHGCTETNTVEVNVVNPLCTFGNNPKVWVCHRPPGNPSNEQSLCISSNAVNKHLSGSGHDDCLGNCDATCVSYSALKNGSIAEKSGKLEYSAIEGQTEMRGTFHLEMQPNPFVSTTTISFSSSFETNARLIVVDVNGREVANLFEGPVSKGTTHTVHFDAGNLQSGIYIIRLIGEDGSSTSGSVLLAR